MTRPMNDETKCTKFGLWIRYSGHCPESSEGFVPTNIDFAVHDYKKKCLMLVEEKRFSAELEYSQKQTYQVLDSMLRIAAEHVGYNYWGFYLIQFAADLPESGTHVNGVPVSVPQLADHLAFRVACAPPLWPLLSPRQTDADRESQADDVLRRLGRL